MMNFFSPVYFNISTVIFLSFAAFILLAEISLIHIKILHTDLRTFP